MSRLHLTLLFISIVGLFMLPAVKATTIPSNPIATSSSLLSGIFTVNSSDTPVYAALFALLVIVIMYQVLQRTMLSSGAAAISTVIGAIIFVILFTNPSLIQIFLGVYFATALICILLLVTLIPTRKGSPMAKLLLVVFIAILIYLLFANNPTVGKALNNTLGFDVVGYMPGIVMGLIVLAIIVLLVKAFRKTKHSAVKALVPVCILILLALFFVPGFGTFLLSPIGLVSILVGLAVFTFIFFTAIRKGK